MKRLAATILALLIAVVSTAALAEPTATPGGSPSASGDALPSASGDALPSASADTSGLIVYGDSSETIVRIQLRLRELGYFNYKPTGNFQNMTVEATKRFQQKQTAADGSPIMADGTIGAETMAILFLHGAVRADIDASIPIGSGAGDNKADYGELADWSEIKELLNVGTSYLITDFNTGVQWTMTFTGGENHAEMECPTSGDAAIYLETFGGAYNYSKRSVIVSLSGRSIAASLQGWPHGDDTISGNDMDGHACLYFSGSLSHVAGLSDVEHQNLVYKAAGRS